jgi:hypothetical protein
MVVFTCQYKVGPVYFSPVLADYGDSGAPVFTYYAATGGPDDVRLEGLISSIPKSGENAYWLSPWFNIYTEFRQVYPNASVSGQKIY